MITVDKVKPGKYFMSDNHIYLKVDLNLIGTILNGINTNDGSLRYFPPQYLVLPVDVIIRAQTTTRINHDS